MAIFSYKATDINKHVITGNTSAKDRQEVAIFLGKKGLVPLVIKETIERTLIKGSVPDIDKITFCRYLATMLASGLSLSEGVEVLRHETKHPIMRRILNDIMYSLEQGQQLSSVFERYPNVFASYFLTLTRAGEVSGKLVDVLKYLENELHSEYSLKAKVKGALLYPGIVFVAMLGIGVFMLFFVLPQIGRVFLDLKLPLPAPTRLLFTFSIAMSKQMIPILVGAVIALIGLIYGFRIQKVRDFIFSLIRLLPMVHAIIKKIDLARFNRIFSTLLRSAVPITEALEISLETMILVEYRKLNKSFPASIREGKTLADTVKNSKVFPTLMVQMVQAGEKTGTLDTSLADLATFYEQEVEEELKNLTQIIEPVLMLFVGISVGAMILSIIAPIYSVVGSFQQAAGGKP